MIVIETWKDAGQLKVRVNEHADSASKDWDRVCCVAYVLTQALAFNTKTNIYNYNGAMDITMDNDWHNKTLFDSYLASMKMLASQCPDCIAVKEA